MTLSIYYIIKFLLLNFKKYDLAAHCCDGAGSVKAFFADIDRRFPDAGEFSETIRSDRIFIHELYRNGRDGSIYNHDLCLIETAFDLINPRNDYCRNHLCTAAPCFPHPEFIPGSKCYAAGWGYTQSRGRGRTNKLQQIGINTFSNEYCLKKSYKTHYA